MEARLLVIKKILDALDIPSSVETVVERVKVQKAVYLAQRAGIRLGYTYGWYLRGPYSPRLTKDYFELHDALAVSGTEVDKVSLRDDAAERMVGLRPLMDPPDDFRLEKQHLWLELLASYDYLRKVEEKSANEAAEIIKDRKPRLAPYVGLAKKHLAKFDELFAKLP